MIDRKTLLDDLQRLLPKIEADLLERSESSEIPEVGRNLREEYRAAQAAARTAMSFEAWRSDLITQVAVAWVLSCVFARFLEDNELVPTPKLAGPGERLRRARDERELYFRGHPTFTDRDYLLSVFDELTKHSATEDVFGPRNPIRDLPSWLSGDAAGELIAFFQRVDPNTGHLVHDFTDPAWDTRFLGDLYQDLSESARKKYALLQTPVFVEEFILDRALVPAIEEFGLAKPGYEGRLEPEGRLHPGDRFRMIDPACGAGHFLLGGFARLLELWRKKDPGARSAVLAQRALDSVHGVDLNPYAIAIARFRLLLAALKECGMRQLKNAPGFEVHLACGDSLLHGSGKKIQQHFGDWDPLAHVYQPEDREALHRLLRRGSYHAVVANPPYITPRDGALNQAYRSRYSTCHGQYSLAVPFMERIISLAADGGFTGQITANSFMNNEFGSKLVEKFLPSIDISHVVDTRYLQPPGHATPTVILFARARSPVRGAVRLVVGIKGEYPPPPELATGGVWSGILRLIDRPGASDDYVSVVDIPRVVLARHPWSLGGGGAADLKIQMESKASYRLGRLIDAIGRTTHTGEDPAFVLDHGADRTRGWTKYTVSIATGVDIREYALRPIARVIFPYDKTSASPIECFPESLSRHFWRNRTTLKCRRDFGHTIEERGLRWIDHSMFFPDRFRARPSIAFAFKATHNHFIVDREERVFNRPAPAIILSSNSPENLLLGLFAILNSSTTALWEREVHRQVSGAGEERWEVRLERNAGKYEAFPLPEQLPVEYGRKLDELAQCAQFHSPDELLERWQLQGIMPGNSIKDSFQICEREWNAIRERMIALQEELDWACYRLYGLIDDDLTHPGEPPPLRLGGRAFEIAMGAKMASGELQTTWFERHNATPLPGPHPEWPRDYQDLVRRRMEVIASDRNIALIEQPEYKRRWNTEPWADQLARALRSWLLDRLESQFDFDGRMNDDDGKPTASLPMELVSVGRLADVARRDAAFLEVGALYRDDPAFDVTRLVADLVESESVPLLPVLRYKPPGLRKRAEWETTWELQRREDAIDARAKLPKDHPDHLTEEAARDLKKTRLGAIPVPPKYKNTDFLKTDFWRLRGKLDVPKERWVSFPHCEGEDGTLMVAWAGYDHLQLARAISAHYVDVQERLGGRDDPRLVPLLACLVELLPWLKQWHNEVDPEFGLPMGDYFEGFLQEESRNLSLTLDEIKAWQPPQRARGGARGRRRANK